MKQILRVVFPQTKEEYDNMMEWLTTPLVWKLKRETVIVCIPACFMFASMFSKSLILALTLYWIGVGLFLLLIIRDKIIQRIQGKRSKQEEEKGSP